jgi:hypothetical protein
MRDMASEVRIWPPIIKPVRGSVVMISSLVGLRMPFLKAGMWSFKLGYTLDIQLRNKHHDETQKNCMTVSVTGFGKVFKIWPADVFASMEVRYQMAQSN